MNKWFSRKFLTMAVAFVFTAVGMIGFDIPLEEVIVVDAIAMFYVLVEGMLDAIK